MSSCYKDHEANASSKFKRLSVQINYCYSAVSSMRMLIILGKINCDEFGMGSSNEIPLTGSTRMLPMSPRVPGGSS